mmetsp:Transcript_72699/g.224853  ORF Transcript_72699/g.224853 Transcript_72699/m.224853 type:complete len:81 (+) Transcript_72699:254-496(+)
MLGRDSPPTRTEWPADAMESCRLCLDAMEWWDGAAESCRGGAALDKKGGPPGPLSEGITPLCASRIGGKPPIVWRGGGWL